MISAAIDIVAVIGPGFTDPIKHIFSRCLGTPRTHRKIVRMPPVIRVVKYD